MAWFVYLGFAVSVFHLVSADVSVQQGELSQVNSSNAILSMSGDTSQKSIWWKFLQSDSEAFLRYLVSIPVREDRLGELNRPCDKDYLKEIRDKGGLLATRNASIAEYYSSEHIKNLGTMKIWMWLLGFVCLKMDQRETNPNTCESITPVVLRVTPQDFDMESRNWTRYSPAYFSLWEILSTGQNGTRVTNSVPSRIVELSIPYNTDGLSFQQGFRVRTLAFDTYKELPNCGGLGIDTNADLGTISLSVKGAQLPSPAVADARRAGYRYYGGTAKCYGMGDEFKNATGSEFLTVLGPAFLPAKVVPGCQSESPYLLTNQSGFYACLTDTGADWQFYCARFNCNEVEAEASLVPYFKAVYQAPRNRSDSLMPLERQSCSSASQILVRTFSSRSSNFPDVEAPVCEPRRVGKPDLCLWGIDPPRDLLQTSSDVDIINSMFSQLRSSYVSEHISLLNLEQGAPTDFWLLAITLPSAFIAVTAGVVPLTDGLLKLVRNLKASPRLKTALVCCCNLVLAVASYSAVVALTPSELQRQKSFQTWGLHADELPVTNHGLRVMVVIQGISTYKSGSLVLAWVSTAVLMPVVLLITLLKCKHEFGARTRRIKHVRLEESSTPAPKRLLRSRTSYS